MLTPACNSSQYNRPQGTTVFWSEMSSAPPLTGGGGGGGTLPRVRGWRRMTFQNSDYNVLRPDQHVVIFLVIEKINKNTEIKW